MSGWRKCKIADIAEKIAMGPFGSNIKVETFVESGVPVISGQHLHETRLREESGYKFVTEEHAEKLKNSCVVPGDIVFTHAGTIGQVAVIPRSARFDKYVISQRQFYLRVDRDQADPAFVARWFHSPDGRHRLLMHASQVGVPSISRPASNLREIEIDLPSLGEQKDISAIIDVLDDKIEVNRKTSALLEEMARALYRSWFVSFDPVTAAAEGRPLAHLPSELAALFPTRFQDNGLPEGWKQQSLADFMDIKGGTQPPKSTFKYTETPGFVRLVQIRDYETDQHPTFVRDVAGLRKCEDLDVMIGRYGASVGRICWGMTGAYNVALVKAEPFNILNREFVRSVCLSLEFQEYIQAISGRSAQAGFNKGDIAAFQIVGGSQELRTAFSQEVYPIRLAQIAKRQESQTLAALRDSLLPRLMSGALRVGAARAQVEAVV